MAEELQGLLERIQKDGIEKADADASRIVEEARAKATDIVKQAEAKAKALIEKAQEDGKLFEQRGESAVAQAARDVVLSVGDAITATLQGIVSARVDAALSADDFPAVIKSVVSAYASSESNPGIEVLLSNKQQEQVSAYLLREMESEMNSGLAVKGDKGIVSGFRVSITESGVQHDFTGATLTEALCALLRPQLAEIVKRAMSKDATT